MTRTTSYLVMTRRPPPNHDAGFWTEHSTLKDARSMLAQWPPHVAAKLYRVIVTYNATGDRRETLSLMPRRVSRRQDVANANRTSGPFGNDEGVSVAEHPEMFGDFVKTDFVP